MLACRSVFARGYPTRERMGLFPTLWCDWWFAVIVDGLMEAALLLLVGGLIHHSPVQVCHRHLASSHLIQLLILSLHHLLPFTPQTSHLLAFLCLVNAEWEQYSNIPVALSNFEYQGEILTNCSLSKMFKPHDHNTV